MSNRKSHKSRIATSLLSFFLGGIGVHKFYLGKVGWGLIYLIFSWTGLPMILGMFEAFYYFLMSDKEFRAKYS